MATLESSLTKRLGTLSNGSLTDNLFFPFDDSSTYRLVYALFSFLPSVRVFNKTPVSQVEVLLKDEGFVKLREHLVFKRDNKDYEFYGAQYINWEKQVIISLVERDEDRYIPYIDGDAADDDSMRLVEVYYNPIVNLRKLFKGIEEISLRDYRLKVKKNHINFLCIEHGGYRLRSVKIRREFNNNLELNYGPDFLDVHTKILSFLNSDDTGLVLAYGKPGVGKSSYLRYLLSVLEKKVIYIPPHLIRNIAEPDFLGFLLNHSDFILVIEDAEEIVTDRKDSNNSSAVSNLLNLSDGILGDCIKARIICTFNQDINNIDPALVRKGRLKVEWEFKKLSAEHSNKLLKHLGSDYETKEEMSLGDIYNYSSDNLRKEKQKGPIGFGR